MSAPDLRSDETKNLDAEIARGVARERKRVVAIVREALDTGEYERSLGQSIVRKIQRTPTP